MALLNAAAALAALMVAQSSTAEVGRATESEEIVVTAPAAEEVRAFVDALSLESSTGQLARWDRRICPGVMGATTAAAEFILDRIAIRAYEVDLDVGEPGCRPNILIVVTDDSDAMAEGLRGTRAVAHHNNGGNTRGRAAYRAFSESDSPVRWWHVTQTVGADGNAVDGGNPPTLRVGSVGRIRATTREDFSHVIMILDVNRAAGVSLGALADYIAMAALAQLDPEADVSAQPSILNVFAERDAGRNGPTAMTEWDLDYLAGLYAAPSNARNSRQQQRAIEQRMRER